MPTPRRFLASAVFLFTISPCFAQSREPDNSWLMQNYHFTGPPPRGDIQPVNPTVAQLQEIQNTVLSILRKADFTGRFDAALAAAEQAFANAQFIGAVTGEFHPPAPPPPPPPPPQASAPGPAMYLVAFRDGSVQTATRIWTDRFMLHYLTAGGAHVQVRLDLVDRQRTDEWNRPPAP